MHNFKFKLKLLTFSRATAVHRDWMPIVYYYLEPFVLPSRNAGLIETAVKTTDNWGKGSATTIRASVPKNNELRQRRWRTTQKNRRAHVRGSAEQTVSGRNVLHTG